MPESAKVEILINAFTNAAQQAVDDVGDELGDLSRSAQPAQSAMDEVGDELDDTTTSAAVAGDAIEGTTSDAETLAAAMQVVQSRADEAADELDDAGRSAAVTSGLFGRLAVSTGGLSVAMSSLSTVAVLSLIPSLLTLSTILLPLASVLGVVAAAAVGLAGVLGGLTAVGVVTHMDELKAAFQDVRGEIMEIIEPLGDVFGPLLVDAVRALPELVQAIVDSLGPLDQFADTIRELGKTAAEAIPMLTGFLFDLAEIALPTLIDVMEWLIQNGPGIWNAMTRATERLTDPLMAIAGSFADLLPTLHELGIVAATIVLPAIADLADIIDGVAEFVLSLDDGLRRLAVAAAITAPAIFSVASAVATLTGPIGLAVAAVAAFAAAYRANFMGIQEATNDALGGLMDTLRNLIDALSPVIDAVTSFIRDFSVAFQDLGGGDAVSGLVDSIVQGVQAVISVVEDFLGAIQPAGDAISGALSAEDFAAFAVTAIEAMESVVDILRTVVLPVIRFVLLNFTAPLINELARVWAANFDDIVRETRETIDAIMSIVRPTLQALAAFWEAHGETIMAVVRFAFDIIIAVIGTALDAIITTVLVFLNILQGDWGGAWDAIAGFVDRYINRILGIVGDWGPQLVQAFAGILTGIGGLFQDAWTAMMDFLVGALATMLTQIQVWGDTVYNVLLAVWNGVISVMENALEGFINSAVDAINAFLSTLDDVAAKVSEIPGVDGVNVGTLDDVDVDTGLDAERRSINREQQQQQNEQAVRAVLDVQGDNPLARFIEDAVEQNQDRQNRQDTRRTRRQEPQ
jgi:methyl-accepting chemotaxis protein